MSTDLGPEDGHTPSRLHVAEHLLSLLALDDDDLLRLVRVGGMAVSVDSSGEVTRSGPVARPTGGEAEGEWLSVDDTHSNDDSCR